MEITGQWFGQFSGASEGIGILSIEADTPNRAFLMVVQGQEFPPSRTEFEIAAEGNRVKGRSLSTQVFDQGTRRLVPLAAYRASVAEPKDFIEGIEILGTVNEQILEGAWTAPNGRQGKFRLENTALTKTQPAEVMPWSQFKRYLEALIEAGENRFFRGQADSSWRLATSLHRHSRYDLLRYEAELLPELLHRISAFLPNRYDFSSPNELGAFLSLVQHHGFPTPLLDWTRSPYVAAYFAFEGLPREPKTGGSCRLYAFDGQKWMRHFPWHASFADPSPMLTVNEFQAYNNPRHFPQQSVHIFTNVADAEWLIRALERIHQEKYLTAIDISHAERNRVMQDLEYMGISAATMFPGLEGTCRALREKYFLRRPLGRTCGRDQPSADDSTGCAC